MKTIFQQNNFFKSLPEKFTHELIKISVKESFKSDTFLFKEGEQAESFYILLSGQINLEMHVPAHHPLIIQSLKAGDILGWSWLYAPKKWTYDAHCPIEGEYLKVNGLLLEKLFEQNPEWGYPFMRQFSGMLKERLKAARMQLIDVYGEKK
jgi:CRP/FNR family transcriptional regulator, cyclic AMP receptor protein